MTRAVLVLVVLSVLFAGCAKASGNDTLPPPPTASKSDTTGGIEGSIITDEIQPISNAQVAVRGTNQTTVTGADGKFAFSNLEPAEYVIVALGVGYYQNTAKATVKAGEITDGVFVTLEKIPIADPAFKETTKFEDTLIINDSCPQAPDMTPVGQGVSWQDYPLKINDTKTDGTPLAAVHTYVDLKSQTDAATVDIDLYFLNSKGEMLSQSTSSGPDENLTVKRVLPAGDYIVRSCLWAGANSHYTITIEVTYEQGEAALYAREKAK